MKSTDSIRVAVMPIGELESEQLRGQYRAIVSAVASMGGELLVAETASDAGSAAKIAGEMASKSPDLLLLIPLRGLSAKAIEKAAKIQQSPCLIWPVGGGFALPSSALAVGALRNFTRPVELLYAPPSDPTALRKARSVLKASKAFARLARCRIGVIGELFPNLVSCTYESGAITSRLGARLVPVSYDTVRQAMHRIPQDEVTRLRNWITSTHAIEPSDAPPLDPGIRLHLALTGIARESGIEGFATECWSGLPREIGLNPCLGFIDDCYSIACEGDVQLCVSLLAVRWLADRSAYVGDLFDLDLEGTITLVHCGAPASISPDRRDVILGRSQVAKNQGFQTITCRPRIPPGPATVFRLYGPGCDTMHMTQSEIVDCERNPDLKLRARLHGDRWDFLRECFGNHYVVVAGDIREELRLLGRWLGIDIRET